MILCLVPPALIARLDAIDDAVRSLSVGDDVRVLADWRRRDRRGPERRGAHAPAAEDRRRVHNAGGRRIAERRATLRPLEQTVSRLPGPVAAGVRLVERVEPTPRVLEDACAARLVVRFQQRDQAAFVELYERYADVVYGYARTIVATHEAAEDVAHDVFLRAFQSLSTFERREAPFRAWLLTIARNVALRHRAAMARTEPVDDDTLFDRPVEPPLLESAWPQDGGLAALVGDLPLAQRQVVLLRYLVDLTPGETATVLSRSPEAVRQLQCRALRTLRCALAARPRELVAV